MLFNRRDLGASVAEIRDRGVGVVPDFLTTEARQALLSEFRQYSLIQQPALFGPHFTRQELKTVGMLPAHSLFLQLRDKVATWLNEEFSKHFPSYLSEPLVFSDVTIQTYDRGPIGVEPHLDGARIINLIALIVLEGTGQFSVCDDREGSNLRPVRNEAGDMLLMRGPGFLGSDHQPFHCIRNIATARTVVALRHDATSIKKTAPFN